MAGPHSLENKLALVTGAAGPTGHAISCALADAGAKVTLADLDGDRLAELCALRPDDFSPLTVDVSDAGAVEAAWKQMRAECGAVDILVNNAGILSNNKSAETEPEEWRRVLAVNLDGPFYLSRLCLPDMRKAGWGRIVNMCSLAMKTGGVTAGTAYTASKGALGALTFSLARECARDGVTVNGIAPAYIKTPMVTEQLTEAQRQDLLKAIPVGRFCEPEEVGHLVAYLASPMAGFITGEIVDINGGFHLD
jgi:3-oxoacyl-[acyl-carrier protein] reductase